MCVIGFKYITIKKRRVIPASAEGKRMRAKNSYKPQTRLKLDDAEAYLRHVINGIPDHPIRWIEKRLPMNVKLQ